MFPAPTQMVAFFVFSTILSWFVKGHILGKKPFGLQMCERQCFLTGGCSSFVYVKSDMACYSSDHSNMTETSATNVGPIHSSKEEDIKLKNIRQRCPTNWKIIRSGSGTYMCLNPKKKDKKVTSKKSGSRELEVKSPRLLLLPFNSLSFNRVHVMYGDNMTVKEIPFPFDMDLGGAVYIQSSKRLALAAPTGIYSTDLLGRDRRPLSSEKGCHGLSFDDHEKLLFFASEKHELYSLHIGTGSLTTILKKISGLEFTWATAVDTNRKIIYLNTGRKIISVGYDGNNKLHWGCCRLVKTLAINDITGDIFFSDKKHLKKKLFGKQAPTIIKLARNLRSLYFYKDTLFASYCDFGKVCVTMILGTKEKQTGYRPVGRKTCKDIIGIH